MEKYCRAGHVKHDNMALAVYMLDNEATDTHSEYTIIISFPLQK